MTWFFSIRDTIYTSYPRKRYIWTKIRILHETDKAILVDNGQRFWIPKSRIHKIKLKNNTFEIYTKESTMAIG